MKNKYVGDVDNHLNNIKNSLIDVTKDQDLKKSAKLIKVFKGMDRTTVRKIGKKFYDLDDANLKYKIIYSQLLK